MSYNPTLCEALSVLATKLALPEDAKIVTEAANVIGSYDDARVERSQAALLEDCDRLREKIHFMAETLKRIRAWDVLNPPTDDGSDARFWRREIDEALDFVPPDSPSNERGPVAAHLANPDSTESWVKTSIDGAAVGMIPLNDRPTLERAIAYCEGQKMADETENPDYDRGVAACVRMLEDMQPTAKWRFPPRGPGTCICADPENCTEPVPGCRALLGTPPKMDEHEHHCIWRKRYEEHADEIMARLKPDIAPKVDCAPEIPRQEGKP